MSYNIETKDIDTETSDTIQALGVGHCATAKLLLSVMCRLSISHICIALDGVVEWDVAHRTRLAPPTSNYVGPIHTLVLETEVAVIKAKAEPSWPWSYLLLKTGLRCDFWRGYYPSRAGVWILPGPTFFFCLRFHLMLLVVLSLSRIHFGIYSSVPEDRFSYHFFLRPKIGYRMVARYGSPTHPLLYDMVPYSYL